MEIVYIIIQFCIQILTIEINLFGYKITLMAVAIFVALGAFLLGFLRRLFA